MFHEKTMTKQQQQCPNSPDHEHEWVTYGNPPSVWEECQYCFVTKKPS